MADPIQVLIVDDHAVVRAGIKLLLVREDDMEPVGEAGSGREAIFEARSLKPDVILMDVVMPDGNGLEVIPTLLRERPETKILVLSMQDDPRYVREAFAAGASGYVLKEAADVEVVAAVREVARGGRYVHPELGARLIAADADAARKAEEDPLSDREREVLRLLALGHTNQEIAKQLFISVRTAETHRAHIMQKLRSRRIRSPTGSARCSACWRSGTRTRRSPSSSSSRSARPRRTAPTSCRSSDLGGSALRPGARGAPPAGARAHEPGDRQAALHLGPHGRDAPRPHHAEAPISEDPLSDREREVLRLLALGHTNQEIAKQLFISVRTAETHRAHIMQKLSLQTRAELVRYALEQGMLEP